MRSADRIAIDHSFSFASRPVCREEAKKDEANGCDTGEVFCAGMEPEEISFSLMISAREERQHL